LLTKPFAAACLTALLSCACGLPALGGDVTVEQWRGHAVLKLTGVIDEGTAEKFAQAADKVKPLPYGLPVLLLDSPGGSVGEALKISVSGGPDPALFGGGARAGRFPGDAVTFRRVSGQAGAGQSDVVVFELLGGSSHFRLPTSVEVLGSGSGFRSSVAALHPSSRALPPNPRDI